jgi:hypothetical protein
MTIPTPRSAHPDEYLAHNLQLVVTGRKSRAAGIRRCADCDTPFIKDNSGLAQCRTCRTNHHRECETCHQRMANTANGDRICESCADQIELFTIERTVNR